MSKEEKLDPKILITEVENDLRRTGVGNWRQKGEDRIEWHVVR